MTMQLPVLHRKTKELEKISKPISDLQVQQHSVQYHDITSNNED